ncbi:hypothetical protein [Leptospira kmetyi]|uniref:hypothetical protein n=1 Tax=Leptospira kmetyi TaxID=408139 RepID=UPI000F63A8A8|nr:hypothetical protein [Leptospira kmetyi]
MFRENRIATLLLFAGLSAGVNCSERTATNPRAHKTQKVLYMDASILRIIQIYLKTPVNDSHKQTKNCVFCHSDEMKI